MPFTLVSRLGSNIMLRNDLAATILLLVAPLLAACSPPSIVRGGDLDGRAAPPEVQAQAASPATEEFGPPLPVTPEAEGEDESGAIDGPGFVGPALATPTPAVVFGPRPQWPTPMSVLPTPVRRWMVTDAPTATPWPSPTEPATPTPDPFLAAGPPVRLEAPTIGVQAYVEQVGLTDDNAMDVPKGWMNTGWFLHGFRPGEPGNSVIAGHLDTNTGGPAVFWDLNKLRPGDEVVVTYANGDRYTFTVQGSELYDANAQGPTIEKIFGSSLTSDLNLVTCDGAWDHGMATYTKRLVVFTTLAPEKTVRAGSGGVYD